MIPKPESSIDPDQKRAWRASIDLLGDWHRGSWHLDDLLERHEPGYLRWQVHQLFRDYLVAEKLLKSQFKRSPRPQAGYLLMLATVELLNRSSEEYPKIVHHAVEIARSIGLSSAEGRFVNAILRSVCRKLESSHLPDIHSTHPAWLVDRWRNQFGESATNRLIEWNQQETELIIECADCPDYAKPCQWEGFHTVSRNRIQEALKDLKAGKVYMQDPFARIPVELLNAKPGERVLDLCAAPGGKTRLIARGMQQSGILVAVDKPGKRLMRLKENLDAQRIRWVKVVGQPVEELSAGLLFSENGDSLADAVMLDVPCSNTGVIRRRPDVKLRLSESSILEQASQQIALLENAAKWVRVGGRLVYSTCSLEHEENAGVITAFLGNNPGWELSESRISYPWECGHDGGGAFLLTKSDHD